MRRIELVWDEGCPHVDAARASLAAALRAIDAAPSWREHRVGDPTAPAYARGAGSPAIFVDGRDVVEGLELGGTACCRVYVGPDGRRLAAPSVDSIVAALRATMADAEEGRR